MASENPIFTYTVIFMGELVARRFGFAHQKEKNKTKRQKATGQLKESEIGSPGVPLLALPRRGNAITRLNYYLIEITRQSL